MQVSNSFSDPAMAERSRSDSFDRETDVDDYYPISPCSLEGNFDTCFSPPLDSRRSPVNRQYTHQDAESLVGGETVSLRLDQDRELKNDKSSQRLGKVFLFSLPLGGFSGIMSGLKLPPLPFGSKEDEAANHELEYIGERIQRQLSVSTADEARHFAHLKGLENVRIRAMKSSLLENISELVPDFIMKTKRSYESVYDELDGPILIMGGYRGSVLREKGTGKRAWVPIKAGLHLRQVNLFLGPSRQDELNATDYIYPDGILKNIGPFDICKKFFKKLHNGKTTVKDFGYDWRVSLDISADKLITTLELLYVETGRKTIVVAHSMGGMVAHGAMQKRPDLFRGIVYVGAPSECLNIIGPVRYGDSIMLSDRILTFETNFMMRSSFAFLPLSGRVFYNVEDEEYYDLDFFNPETWMEYNLNPLVSEFRKQLEENTELDSELSLEDSKEKETASASSSQASGLSSFSSRFRRIPSNLSLKSKPILVTNTVMVKRRKQGKPLPDELKMQKRWFDYKFLLSFLDAYKYLADSLKRTKEYMLGLEYKPELASKYPPLAVVYGNRIPSVRGVYVKSRQDIKDGNYYEFYYGRGDGVIHKRWLLPEDKGFHRYDPKTGTGHIVGKFASDRGHVDLMTDLEVMAEALSAIVGADKLWHMKKK